jgi:hypothetical protein
VAQVGRGTGEEQVGLFGGGREGTAGALTQRVAAQALFRFVATAPVEDQAADQVAGEEPVGNADGFLA